MKIGRIFNRISQAFTGGGATRLVFVPTRSGGVYVDHDTALNFSAVWACQRYLAGSVAQLPWRVHKRLAGGGSDVTATHPADFLLHTRPNPEMSAFNFKRLMIHWAASWGNGFAEIEKDAAGRPTALWPIHPDRVVAKRRESGGLYYEVSNYRAPKVEIEPDAMFHLAGMGADGISGYSVISLASTAIGAGIAGDKFAADFFANGAVLSGGLKTEQKLKDEAYQRLKSDFDKKYTGAGNNWRPLILEQGLEWQTFGMPLKDAEFLAGQKFRVTDICRWFGVPPHKIADLDRATYSNIEHQAIEVVTDTLLPWILPLEQEADAKLISPRNRAIYFTKMKVAGLLRGDSQARKDFYKDMRNMGAMNANEIRALEDLNPIPDGDKYVMQGQYTTLDKIGEQPEPAPFIEPEPEPDEGEPEQ